MATEIARLRATLDAWREAGAHSADPLGFHRLDALARRCQAADAAVQAALQPRVEALARAHAEALARKATAPPPPPEEAPTPPDVHTRKAEETMRLSLGTRVRIVRKGKGGKIEIDFVSEDELHRLYEFMTEHR